MLPKDPFWVTLTEPESPSKVTGLHINIFDSNLLLCTMLHSAPVSKITSVGDNGLYVCNFGYPHVFVSAVSEILPIFCPGRALGNDFLWSTSVVTMDYTWQELSQGHILAYDNTADSFSISHPGGLSIFTRRDNGLMYVTSVTHMFSWVPFPKWNQGILREKLTKLGPPGIFNVD